MPDVKLDMRGAKISTKLAYKKGHVDYEIFEVCEVKVPRHIPDFHVVSITNHFNIGTTKFAAVM
jgi:hypothetical protein